MKEYILVKEPTELLKYGFIEREPSWFIRYIKYFHVLEIRLESNLKKFYVSLNNEGTNYLDELEEIFIGYAGILKSDTISMKLLIEQLILDGVINEVIE